MKIHIFQHLPTLPKAGIFCSSPILCVAFQTFIPERSAFRCFPLPCLSMFRPLVPMHKSALSAAQPAAPPSHAPATPDHHTHTNSQHTLTHRHPLPHFPHRPSDASAKGAAHPPPALCSLPLPRAALTHRTPITPQSPAYQHPLSHFPHRPSDASTKGQHAHSRRCTAIASPSRTHTPHTLISPHLRTPAPTVPLHAQATGRQRHGQRTRPRRYTAYCFSKPHTPAKKPPPPHTQASKKDCPVQEQSFL